MNILLIFLSFFILLFIILFIIMASKIRKLSAQLRNRAHFYVVRDKKGVLNLYLGKPYRNSCIVSDFLADGIRLLACGSALKWYGLNPDDFKDLKWKDEPVEVFINMDEKL